MNNDVQILPAQTSPALDEPLDILFRELELAAQWERPSILFAIYRTEAIRDQAIKDLEEKLNSVGQKVKLLLLAEQNLLGFLQEFNKPADLSQTILFIDGFNRDGNIDGSTIFEEINRYREYFLDNAMRAVFWLCDEDVQKFAARATECWYLRHRVIDLAEEVHPNSIFLDTLDEFLNGHIVDSPDDHTLSGMKADIEKFFNELSVQPSHAASLLILGMLCSRRDDEKSARKFLQAALEIAKTSPDTVLQAQCLTALAALEAELGNTMEAISHYKRAVALTPKPGLIWQKIGLLLIDRGEQQQAVGAFLNAIGESKQDHISWMHLAHCYSELGQPEKAINAYETSLEFSPTSGDAWIGLGKTVLRLGEIDRAISSFRRALELDDQNDQAWQNLGYGLLQQEKIRDAIWAFRRAVDIQPTNVDAWNELGSLYMMQNNYEGVVSALKNVIQFQPESGPAYQNLGIAEYQRGNFEQAAYYFQQAIPLSDERQARASLWDYLGKVHLKLNNQALSQSAFKQAERLTHNTTTSSQSLEKDVPQHLEEAPLEMGDENMIEATNTYEDRSATEWNELGNAFLKAGAFKKAVFAFKKAIEKSPDNSWPYINNLAIAHYQMGELSGRKMADQPGGAPAGDDDDEEAGLFSASENVPLPERNEAPGEPGVASSTAGGMTAQAAPISAAPSAKTSIPMPRNALVDAANLNDLGNRFVTSGKLDEAIEAYKKSIEANPKDGRPYSNLGFVYFKKKNYRLAVLLYQKSLDHLISADEKATTLNRMGDAYRQLRDDSNALLAYRKAREMAPSGNPILDRARVSLCQATAG